MIHKRSAVCPKVDGSESSVGAKTPFTICARRWGRVAKARIAENCDVTRFGRVAALELHLP